MKPKVKKLTTQAVLLTFHEAYLFCRNLLGLFCHPFKTLRIIFREKDFLQAVLIFGLPIYIFVVGLFLIKVLRSLIGLPSSPWGPIAKILGIFLVILAFFLGFYLFYWLWQIVKLKRGSSAKDSP